MANASRKHMGASGLGKGSGAGGMTDLPARALGENMVLSNRDKSRHNEARGLDGAAVQNEQYHDHAGNRLSAADQVNGDRPLLDDKPPS